MHSDHNTDNAIPTTEYAPWVAKYGLRQPYGKCQCGCGDDALLAPKTRRAHGYLKGHPKMFVHGHVAKSGLNVPKRTMAERFWRKVKRAGADDCWVWMGARKENHYGYCLVDGNREYAHRVSWLLEHGAMPDLCVLHKCDNPSCVNPNHLFLGSRAENMEDKIAKGRQPYRLTPGQRLEILERSLAGISRNQLAREYGVAHGTITLAIRMART